MIDKDCPCSQSQELDKQLFISRQELAEMRFLVEKLEAIIDAYSKHLDGLRRTIELRREHGSNET